MMRGVDHWSLAVRRPDETIGIHHWPLVSWMKRYPILKLPILRGVVALVESLVIGVRALTISANESLGEEEQELGKKEIGVTLVIAFAFAVGLFFLAPLFLTGLFERWLGEGFLFWLVEGFVRVGIFLAYLAIVTQIKDLRRVFEYHGAEHMSIHALEHGEELTVGQRREVQDAAPALRHVVPAHRAWWSRSSCSPPSAGRPGTCSSSAASSSIPLIAGISYEIIRFAGRHENSTVVRVIMAPGLALQWMTTKQPDSAQVEVAIAALEKIIELEPQDRPPVKGVEVMA